MIKKRHMRFGANIGGRMLFSLGALIAAVVLVRSMPELVRYLRVRRM